MVGGAGDSMHSTSAMDARCGLLGGHVVGVNVAAEVLHG